MKRFLFVLSVLLLIAAILPSISLADGLDLSSMSLEDLLEVRNAIDKEIHSRVMQTSSSVYNGIYVVGKDVRSGRYLLTIDKSVINDSSDYVEVYIHTFAGEYDSCRLYAGESLVLDLVDGDELGFQNIISATLTDVPPASYAP